MFTRKHESGIIRPRNSSGPDVILKHADSCARAKVKFKTGNGQRESRVILNKQVQKFCERYGGDPAPKRASLIL